MVGRAAIGRKSCPHRQHEKKPRQRASPRLRVGQGGLEFRASREWLAFTSTVAEAPGTLLVAKPRGITGHHGNQKEAGNCQT